MRFLYRLTLTCAHFILHGPVATAVHFYVGDDAVCTICRPLRDIGEADWIYPTRKIVRVEEVSPEEMPISFP